MAALFSRCKHNGTAGSIDISRSRHLAASLNAAAATYTYRYVLLRTLPPRVVRSTLYNVLAISVFAPAGAGSSAAALFQVNEVSGTIMVGQSARCRWAASPLRHLTCVYLYLYSVQDNTGTVLACTYVHTYVWYGLSIGPIQLLSSSPLLFNFTNGVRQYTVRGGGTPKVSC